MTFGRRYDGSSSTKNELSPFSNVRDSSADTIRVVKMPTNMMITIRIEDVMDDMAGGNVVATNMDAKMIVGQRPLHGMKLFVRIAMRR